MNTHRNGIRAWSGAALVAGILGLAGAGNVAATSPSPTRSPGQSIKDRIALQAADVRVLRASKLTPEAAKDPPPETDLRSLGLEKTGAGAYLAHLGFASPFHHLASETVVVSVQAPGGEPRFRVTLRPGGGGTIERVSGSQFTTVDTVIPLISGNEVLLPIPTSLGARPDWEIDAALEVHDAQGNGFHAHSPQVPIASLTGETSPRSVPTSREGALLEGGLPSHWKREAMPSGTRPLSLRLERRSGNLVAVVKMDAAPQQIASFHDRPITTQRIRLLLASDVEHAASPHRLDWDTITGKAVLSDPGGTSIGAPPVTVSGSEVVFQLPATPTPKTTGPRLQLSGNSWIGVVSQVSDDGGNGAILIGTQVRTGVLDPPPSIAPPFGLPQPLVLIVVAAGLALAIVVVFLVVGRRRGDRVAAASPKGDDRPAGRPPGDE